MYGPLKLTTSYLRYYLTASNSRGHGMHSPFVFDFIKKVMNDRTDYPEYHIIEKLRQRLLKDDTTLEVEDFGAGSAHSSNNIRSIASIAAKAAKPAKYGQLLFRIAKYYQSRSILELGTSLGISSSYLASAGKHSRLVTIEGSHEIASVAKRNFGEAGLHNISLLEGNFDTLLPEVLTGLDKVDLAFIDGNHRKVPTEQYFKQLLPKLHNDSIVIFDDIHWSREMESAWDTIKSDGQVRCTIDLFFIGIVFFRKEFKEKRHFTLRF